MSRIKAASILLAVSVAFVPLTANARGPVTASNQPAQQLVQISGTIHPSPFSAGRAGDSPGYNTRINGSTMVFVTAPENEMQDTSASIQ